MAFAKISQASRQSFDVIGRIIDQYINVIRRANESVEANRQTTRQDKLNLFFGEAIQ
jgi:hypothetical protein